MPTPTVCLNMIVKNEAHVIQRCLASVLPFIDHWVIVDTGSTDGTQALVRELMRSKPGALHERPWKSFGHNRNEALQLAKPEANYLFFIDADEQLLLPPRFERARLSADGYYLNCKYGGTTYARCAVVSTRLPWRWEGVVHEYLGCDEPFQLQTLAGPTVLVSHDGARSRDPDTYLKDAALLEEALRTNPNNPRDTFYLAQSYRDAGQLEKSRAIYLRRANMKGWEEEGWYALYQVAMLDEKLNRDPATISFGYLAAYQRRPTRAEPLVRLARYHRLRKEYELALLYARRAAAIPRPTDLLFVDDATYHYSALDELSVAASYTSAKEEGRTALRELMKANRFPESERQRLLDNCTFYGISTAAAPSSSSAGGPLRGGASTSSSSASSSSASNSPAGTPSASGPSSVSSSSVSSVQAKAG
jgi:glycosyltransferase involved in cell wall biosynthesis